ncbi:mannosyltransferase (pig-m) protein [Besnoitia besnoiti]|uniref:GPI mannosyltransferase 1 n=1 Tax=Besnoitia besnoiti TaxID=94643 RepID=A0A2A9M6A8_BESBE|nr:mannosyltransferase (pig-m) protein [Besnoitia besnoiti]PFH34008.1 mannosyltransferase (pig-m) protein [Besnoitia besnoiti]
MEAKLSRMDLRERKPSADDAAASSAAPTPSPPAAAPWSPARLLGCLHGVYVHLAQLPSQQLRRYVYAYAVLLRLGLLVYGEWQDRHLRVKFTDIDYKVYTDAARYVAAGESPYKRHTYRYTPLVAFLCVSNVLLHSCCGKLLFAAADILLSLLTEKLLLLLFEARDKAARPGADDLGTAPSATAPPVNASSLLLSSLRDSTSSSPSSVPSSPSSTASSSRASSPLSPASPSSGSAASSPAKCSAFLLPAFCWTIFPLAATVSTRGNADVIPSLLSLLLLFFLRTCHLDAAAVCYGLAVHVKIFPVVYGIPVLLFLRGSPPGKPLSAADCVLRLPRLPRASAVLSPHSFAAFLVALFQVVRAAAFLFFLPLWLPLRLLPRLNATQWRFGLLSVGTFFGLGGIFYFLYGWPFLYEAYLYHVARVDIRHNFSLFFYLLYLSTSNPSRALGLITFVPQMATCLLVGCYYAQKGQIELALFLQTVIFVALNKVCTSQYFLWWLSLLPFAIASTDMTPRTCWHLLGRLALFQGTNFLWLYFGYAIEFKGQPSFFPPKAREDATLFLFL